LNQIIKTSDGSHTIYVPGLNEHYHSIHGAVQESDFIFLRNGFDICRVSPLNIFEVGFGTGLNALLTAIRSMGGDRLVNYTSIEKYPLDEDTIRSLNYHLYAGPEGQRIYEAIHSSPWNIRVNICTNFTLKKIKGDFTKEILSEMYDLIYFDAFGPDKQPEMWTSQIFAGIAAATRKNGILVTYSAKGEIKRRLKDSGFQVSLHPGPPGKREITRAIKF
jgi:tRNA U34 5-methylaminomethyl-2-thiouridine-forming methyltransferase MnmC